MSIGLGWSTAADSEETDAAHAINFVKLGYGDAISNSNFRSLEFLTDCLSTASIAPAIEQVLDYNAFEGPAVAKAVRQLRGEVSCVQFGRMGSPLLVLRYPYWTHQKEGADSQVKGTRISESQFEEQLRSLKQIFVHELQADEFEVRKKCGREIHVWWN